MEYEGKKTGGTTVSNSMFEEVASANPSAKANALLDALEPSRATNIFMTKTFFPQDMKQSIPINRFSSTFNGFARMASSNAPSQPPQLLRIGANIKCQEST
jgi:hypothetical protein